MRKYNIPTASYDCFNTYEAASLYLKQVDEGRVVIKVDGLAAGKGVVLPANQAEAQDVLREMMVEEKFGTAGQSVVIEEYLEGDEISVQTFSYGKTFKSLPPGQDHKRIFEGNKGPNTGGMGVYAPVSFVSPAQMATIEETILQPTFDVLKNEGYVPCLVKEDKRLSDLDIGRPFVGLLFTGIMMTPSGPKSWSTTPGLETQRLRL